MYGSMYAYDPLDALVMEAVLGIVNAPEPDHPLRPDVAEIFIKDKAKFNKVSRREY